MMREPLQAKRQERLAREAEESRREQELIDRLQAGEEADALEDLKPIISKRSASTERRVKEEFKRCKVVVKEEEIDGVVHFAIQDD
jgi:hypothetical protein